MSLQLKYEEQLVKAKKAQERQLAKKKSKLNDPLYIKKQFEKRLKTKQQAFAKQQEKLSSKEYREKQIEKAKKSANKAIEKSRQKQQSAPKQAKVIELKSRKPLKQSGLKGSSRTLHEKSIQNKLASLGCICCRNQKWQLDGEFSLVNYVSIHHCFGRSKKNNQNCEYLVFPLCEYHHQNFPPAELNPPEDLFPLHGSGRKLWEAVNGKQIDLIAQCYELINEPMLWTH
jgi:hypothetical protein